MSEETTNYGIPNTTLDTEPFPPQTGDLLGAYLARVSRRVRTLEAASAEQSAYQRSLEDRIERLEAKQAEAPAVTTPISELSDDGVAELRRWAKAGDSVNQPLLCATCGHDMDSHRRDGLCNGHKRKRWCDGGTLGKPCKCREFTPVATPTVTRERTHGRYGTRNLTKSKPDHIVDANKKVCATCGHAKEDYRQMNSYITDSLKMWCNGGTLGKPCLCREYKPVA